MRILSVSPSYWPAFQYGGPIYSVHGLNKALAKKAIDITAYTTNVGLDGKVTVNKEVDVDGVKVTYFTFSNFFEFIGTTGWQFSLPMTRALKRSLKMFDVTYIVAVWNYPAIVAPHYCRKYKKPYIIAPRGALYPYSANKKFWKKWPYYHLIIKKGLKGATAIHYTTKDEQDQVHRFLGFKSTGLIVPNGIDISEFSDLPDTGRLRSRYPYLKGKKVILFLGRIHSIKGLDILVKAYATLRKDRNNVHLLIVGNDEGGYQKKVLDLIKKEQIQGEVTFTGMLTGKEKLEAYVGSDMFVLASYSENFGLSVIEAMACNLPVLISDKVGIHEDIARARAGIVINTDPKQLAKVMLHLLDNTDICKEMGNNGRRLVQEEFTWDKVADHMIAAFNQIVYK
jgi:glycosyltransferase involved in cell wall biosynthesis